LLPFADLTFPCSVSVVAALGVVESIMGRSVFHSSLRKIMHVTA
jgi:hypothetical protein